MRSTAFFKLYKICILLHRCNLKIFAKNRFEKTAIFVKFQQKKLQMSQNLQNFVKFQKFQLENLVDFEKCCKTHIFLQKSEPIQPKTSNILPKFCQPTLSDVAAATGCCPWRPCDGVGGGWGTGPPGRRHRGRQGAPLLGRVGPGLIQNGSWCLTMLDQFRKFDYRISQHSCNIWTILHSSPKLLFTVQSSKLWYHFFFS